MNRADLLALTVDSLAALTNRGLVKRATKELDSGAGPAVEVDADGAVRAEYPDGIHVVLPAGASLDAATCTCPATATCRHLIALVLAYQRRAAEAPPASTQGSEPAKPADPTDPGGPAKSADPTGPAEPAEPAPEAVPEVVPGVVPAVAAPPEAVSRWSPGDFTDKELEELVGSRALAAARRTLRSGFTARVRRPTREDPVPSVELAACNVRFLVPHQLSYVHTDAAASARVRLIPLAVWAFRVADEQTPGVPEVLLDVGGVPPTSDAGSGLGPALALTEEILLDGVTHTGPALAATFARVRRDLDAAGLRWPLLALDDLDDQLHAYRERGARYRAERTAHLIAEVHARHRAVTFATGLESSPRSRVLGTQEAASTPLRRVRLVSLGCRVTNGNGGSGGGTTTGVNASPAPADPAGEERIVDVYLAHPESGSVLVLRRGWKVENGQPLTGHQLGRKRVGGVRLTMLASGEVVSESAVRSASRMMRLATSQVAKSSATPFSDSWSALPDALLVRDLAEEGRVMGDLPPRLIRPRVEAEFVKAVEIGKVCSVGYHSGDQRLSAVIEDRAGVRATISATYRSACPGALDALADALGGALAGDDADAQPRYVSGILHRTQGEIVIDPLAVVVGSNLVVIDLAPGDGTAGLDAAVVAERPGPVEEAVSTALSLLAEAAHQGLRHLPRTFPDRLTAAGDALTRCGLLQAGSRVKDLVKALGPDPDGAAAAAWVDAHIRLNVTDECL